MTSDNKIMLEEREECFVRRPDSDAVSQLADSSGISKVVAQILFNRGFDTSDSIQDFLDARLSGLTSPTEMADLTISTERIVRAILQKEKIVVFGDYDVDGTTSAIVLSEIIEALGGDVEVVLANRFEGGYGLSHQALSRCLDCLPSLLITCDCGSSDHERIALAVEQGIDVIVLDHHLVPEEPLPAFSFLNPHRPECNFEYKGLASVGLALLLGASLRKAIGANLDIRKWLDLVAVGTIADYAPLQGDNRRLVRAGLRQMSTNAVRPGLRALLDHARIVYGSELGSKDISFGLAPRLNAPGRLGDPMLSYKVLSAKSSQEARKYSVQVERLNLERREIEAQNSQEAIQQVLDVYGKKSSANKSNGQNLNSGIFVFSENFHRGVVGIVAARLVERFKVPALVAAVEGNVAHGSGRAPGGFPLYDCISRCQSCLSVFGGHQAAIGFSLLSSKLDLLRDLFAEASHCFSVEANRSEKPIVDVEVDAFQNDLPTVDELMQLEPFGEANQPPVFLLNGFKLQTKRVIADHHLKMKGHLGSLPLSIFAKGMAEQRKQISKELRAVGHLRTNLWAGKRTLELDAIQIFER